MSQVTALNRQGVALKQQGRYEEAANCYEQAIRLAPDFAEAHFNLGLLCRDLGRIGQAVSCLERTMHLRPDLRMVQTELGRLYLEQQRWKDAEQIFSGVLDSEPGDLTAQLQLAVAIQEQGRLVEAEAAYREILRHAPRNAPARANLGHVLKSRGNLAEAIHCYEQAIESDPLLAEAHSNLGNSWLALGHFDAALAEYSIAAGLRPNCPRSHIDLGNAWQRLEKFPEAVSAYSRAIELDPNATDAWLNATHLLKEVGDFAQASRLCRELGQRRPHDRAHRLREAAICPLVFGSRRELDEYRDHLTSTIQACDGMEWDFDFARWTVYAPECPYNLQFLDGNLRPLKEAFARLYQRSMAKYRSTRTRQSLQRRRPRIGFVVTARHERAFLKLLGGIVERLDADRWELVVLCSQLGASAMREGLRRQDIAVVPFPERFDLIVSTIAESSCDLLYYWEVGNDPTNYFLPFLRLAACQVTSWGIQVTTGIPTIDAYLSSDLVEAPEADEHYTERLIRASTLLTYQTPVRCPAPKPRDAFGIGPSANLYGCVQNLGKFHPDFDEALAKILRHDPKGIIVVARDRNGFAAQALQSRWQAFIPDVASRIVFVPPLSQSDYLALLANCDVLLDPLHFGGVTTTYDAVALGLPLVTLPTEFHRGRYTAACLRKAGVVETIANDLEDYVDIAVRLGTDRESRAETRNRLLAGASGIFEDEEAVLEHERILEELLGSGRSFD